MSLTAHPFFTSPLRWNNCLDEALISAREQKRAVFLVHGSRDCMGTRGFVERTLAKDEVAELVNERFVCVVSEPATVAADVRATLDQLPVTESSPRCVYLGSDGRILHATAGGRPAAVLINDMLQALAKL